MELKHGLISADDHVQEHPDVWTSRMSHAQWGDRIPHLAHMDDGSEEWMIEGWRIPFSGVALAGAAMPERGQEPKRWSEVPCAVFSPAERLKTMDIDGIDYSVLYPSVSGVAGQNFGNAVDPVFESACVNAYNDWLIEEWTGASPRFVPQCIVPIWPMDSAVAEINRAVKKGHKGVIY
ncbi:MAG: amidohydrolase family protein, partial [Candidatus Binatia bacterium]